MGIFDALKKKKKSSLPPKKEKAVVEHAHEHKKEKEDMQREKRVVSASSRAHAVLLRPFVSEKTAVAESLGAYTFVVSAHATKPAVVQAVHDAYGVRPVSVRILHVQGKQVRAGRAFAKRSDWKKAVVTLPKGKSIHIHEGV